LVHNLQPQLWSEYLIEYHRQFREEKKEWPLVPVQVVTDMIKGLPIPSRFIDKLKIGDFGCGEAELSSLLEQNKVYSLLDWMLQFSHCHLWVLTGLTILERQEGVLQMEAI
jgi:hypothetical protein